MSREQQIIDLCNQLANTDDLRIMIHDLDNRLRVIEADRHQWLELQMKPRWKRILHNVRLFFQ
jgi:hypothetical protein